MTKLRVKTTGNYSFDIEVELDDTVADVKRTIEASQGANSYPADRLLVLHSGRILKDQTTLKENGVTEKSFLVIWTSTKKRGLEGNSLGASSSPAKKLATESKEAGSSSSGQSTDSAAQTVQPREPRFQDPPRDTQSEAAPATGSGTNEPAEGELGDLDQLTNSDQQAVDRLVAMGFTREAALEAFLVYDKNEEQAAYYLIAYHVPLVQK